MNSCPRMTTVDYARHDTAQGFIIVPKGRLIAPFYVETHLGPWGWQWRGGVSGMVSVPQPSIPITVKTLMDDIEKVGTLRRAHVLFITDEQRLGCARDVQNCHRLCILDFSRMPFSH